MISVTDLRAGTTYEDNGQLFVILSYEHIKMGRGSANIKVKIKNVRSGTITDKSFINGAKVSNVHVAKKDLQFLYQDEDFAYFMNPTTYEQIQISRKVIGPDNKFLKEGESFNISFLEDEALSVNLPPKLVFEVIDTAPGIKGNSATNVFKDAELPNGIMTKVPLFVNNGDKIRIDTRTGAYVEKA